MANLTDFFDDVIGKTGYSRLELWKDKVVIDKRGQVRINQQVLVKLGKLPDEPRVIIRKPDKKRLGFWFVSREFTESEEFRTAYEDRNSPRAYTFTEKTKNFSALDALRRSGIKDIADMITYRDSDTKRGKQYPDSIGFGEWEVDTEQMTIWIDTTNMEKRTANSYKKKSKKKASSKSNSS
jgi:hypothetical protein